MKQHVAKQKYDKDIMQLWFKKQNRRKHVILSNKFLERNLIPLAMEESRTLAFSDACQQNVMRKTRVTVGLVNNNAW